MPFDAEEFIAEVRLAGLERALRTHPDITEKFLRCYCGDPNDDHDFGRTLDETDIFMNETFELPAGFSWRATKWILYIFKGRSVEIGLFDYFEDMNCWDNLGSKAWARKNEKP